MSTKIKHTNTSVKIHGGVYFDFLKPEETDVTIEQVAHHLSMCNRYCGALTVPISVAQHCVLVDDIVQVLMAEKGLLIPDEDLEYWLIRKDALLHDATEFVMGDMVHPLKIICPDFKKHEDNINEVLASKLGYRIDMPAEIKQADLIARYIECNSFDPSFSPETTSIAKGIAIPQVFLDRRIEAISWQDAKYQFLARHAFIVSHIV